MGLHLCKQVCQGIDVIPDGMSTQNLCFDKRCTASRHRVQNCVAGVGVISNAVPGELRWTLGSIGMQTMRCIESVVSIKIEVRHLSRCFHVSSVRPRCRLWPCWPVRFYNMSPYRLLN